MGEIHKDSDEIRLAIITESFNNGMRYGDITPDMQITQWLALGLKRLEERGNITVEDIKKIDGMGGTRDPDPFIRPESKLI